MSILSDQIDSQTDKISELQRVLDDKKDVLRKTEDVLQREMLTRSSLETKKLELLSEMSSLKLRQAAVEKENADLRKRLNVILGVEEVQQDLDFMHLPPTGRSVQTTLKTFGTMPRKSKKAEPSYFSPSSPTGRAVSTPTGSCNGAHALRAKVSAITTRLPPSNAAAGISCRWS